MAILHIRTSSIALISLRLLVAQAVDCPRDEHGVANCNQNASLLQAIDVGASDGDTALSSSSSHGFLEKRSQGASGNKVGQKSAQFWNHPATLGFALGVLLIGPDHLGTLMAFSTLTRGLASFKVGFCWGVGHSVGMVLICPIFYALKHFSTKTWNVSVEQWEYWGDYFVGASMFLVSIYFLIYENRYLRKNSDGTYEVQGCECHAPSAIFGSRSKTRGFCQSFSSQACGEDCTVFSPSASFTKKQRRVNRRTKSALSLKMPDGDEIASTQDQGAETTPLITRVPVTSVPDPPESIPDPPEPYAKDETFLSTSLSARNMQSVIVGTLQGLCCPMGLMGITCMGRISGGASTVMLSIFLIFFVGASGLGSGAITALWGHLSSSGCGHCISPRFMYISSSVSTALLGLFWMGANYGGFLEQINYTEQLHHNIKSLQDI